MSKKRKDGLLDRETLAYFEFKSFTFKETSSMQRSCYTKGNNKIKQLN